jgi:hypothetical protein
MYEWHMKMHHYQEQLKVYHLEHARHFQKMMEERAKTPEIKDTAGVS